MTMSDGPRTRIAAVIYDHPNPLSKEQCQELADVLIRELGLEVEDGECSYCQAQLPGCRYVTELTHDD
jgi:hypothetical protein